MHAPTLFALVVLSLAIASTHASFWFNPNLYRTRSPMIKLSPSVAVRDSSEEVLENLDYALKQESEQSEESATVRSSLVKAKLESSDDSSSSSSSSSSEEAWDEVAAAVSSKKVEKSRRCRFYQWLFSSWSGLSTLVSTVLIVTMLLMTAVLLRRSGAKKAQHRARLTFLSNLKSDKIPYNRLDTDLPDDGYICAV